MGFKQGEGSDVQTSGGNVSQEVWKVMKGWEAEVEAYAWLIQGTARKAGWLDHSDDRQTELKRQPAARHWVVDRYGGEVGSSR